MNKRQWKKACYKAAMELTRLYPNAYELTPAVGSELVAAPAAFLSHYHGTKVLYTHVFAPRGILLARRKGHGTREDEQCRTALELLNSAHLRNDFERDTLANGSLMLA